MSSKASRRVRGAVAGISLVVGAGIITCAQGVSAFAPAGGGASATGECLFSVQLQKSVTVRRSYLARLDEVLGRTPLAENSVEKMYGSIEKASYSVEEEQEAPAGRGLQSYWSYARSKRVQSEPSEMDVFSADCMSCHDGVGAVAIGIDLRNRPFDRSSRVVSFTSDHPIGMHYQSYVNANRGYKPVWGNKMVFVNGRVGCLTCHDPLNPERGHLVMSDRGSALCRSCHNK